MPTFLSPETYATLIADLSSAFTSAAHSTTHSLHDLLAEALANADVLPEACRADFAGQTI
ncbi:hypothetical protein E4L95_01995 [Paracoccus liaowanqingii]|uniref:Uncharacterized protein n=1 Tax=Paracoccus liaowanqingii TaxID=2560053 RepID=A0A4Z1CSM3_9RHOB|nr:hypothetical protein [Paracoccus liaowanqingii]TGN68283.1 hypothetical protein E4L95_01995 [Paracoccus liaowanqingii]